MGVTRRAFLAAFAARFPAVVVLRAATGETLADTGSPGRFHPGSTAKPFTAVALIDSRHIHPQKCSGRRGCSHPAIPEPLDLSAALAYSCNSYFADAGSRLAPSVMTAAFHRFGFDAEVPNTPEQRALMAMGEWGVFCSLRELAEAYRKLALSGKDQVVAGLKAATEYGTARLARPAGISVAGKTGTNRHAMFAGWAPDDVPRIVVAVLTNGRGGSDAAPVARSLFEKYL